MKLREYILVLNEASAESTIYIGRLVGSALIGKMVAKSIWKKIQDHYWWQNDSNLAPRPQGDDGEKKIMGEKNK